MNVGTKKVIVIADSDDTLSSLFELLDIKGNTASNNKQGYIRVKSAESFQNNINDRQRGLEMYSNILPFGTELIVDMDATGCSEYLFKKTETFIDAELLLFIEGYPFTTESLLDRLCGIGKFLYDRFDKKIYSSIGFRVVFYNDLKRHYSSSDLDSIDTALKKAPDEMRKRLAAMSEVPLDRLVDFIVLSDPSEISKALVFRGNAMNYTMTIKADIFKQWRNDIFDTDLHTDYSFSQMEYSFLTDHDRIESILKYEKVRGSQNLTKTYAENYYKEFSETIYRLASDFYERCIGEICFWNIDADKKRLKSRIDTIYSSKMTIPGKYSCPISLDEYNKLRSTYKIDIAFSKSVIDFVNNDVFYVVKEHLDDKLRILSGIFGNAPVSAHR